MANTTDSASLFSFLLILGLSSGFAVAVLVCRSDIEGAAKAEPAAEVAGKADPLVALSRCFQTEPCDDAFDFASSYFFDDVCDSASSGRDGAD